MKTIIGLIQLILAYPDYVSEYSNRDSGFLLLIIMVSALVILTGIFIYFKKRRNRVINERDDDTPDSLGRRILSGINFNTVIGIISCILLVIVIIILLCGISKISRSERAIIRGQKAIADSVAVGNSLLREQKIQNDSMIKLINARDAENSRLAIAVENQNVRISKLENGISDIKKSIGNLVEQIDSLENRINIKLDSIYAQLDSIAKMIEICCDSNTTSLNSVNGISKNRELVIEEVTFNKKGNELMTDTILSSRESLNIIYGKTIEFSVNPFYKYVNENSEPVSLSFYNKLSGDSASYAITENTENKISLISSETKSVIWDKGGSLYNLKEPINWNWESDQFYKKFVDKRLRKQGVIEIIVGGIAEGAGIFGVNYFDKHPSAIFNIRNSEGEIVQTIRIENEFGKAVSYVAIGAGGLSIAKGVLDLFNSVQITPFGFKITQTIE